MDATVDVALAWAGSQVDVKVSVVRHGRNLGYGGNQKAAYELAIERGHDHVILLHGDGQYNPAHLSDLVEPLLRGSADAVFGSRMMIPGAARKGGMPAYKWLGNKVLTHFENRLLGTGLSEFHSGYRAYSLKALKRVPFSKNSNGFDFDTQIIVQLLDAGLRIREIPIDTYYGDEICYVNGFKYAGSVMADVTQYRAFKLGLGSPSWIARESAYDMKDGGDSSHRIILSQMSDLESSRVLDVGCSGGYLSALMRQLGHHVTGVDLVEIPGVRQKTDRFLQADISQGIPEAVGSEYDVIVVADVLEHVPDPAGTLAELERLLTRNGRIIISVPNMGHWYPRARIALGAFDYDRRGPLDETHLRFFSRRSLARLVRDADLAITKEGFSTSPLAPSGLLRRSTTKGRASGSRVAGLRPGIMAYQFVLTLESRRWRRHCEIFERDGSLTALLKSQLEQPQPAAAATHRWSAAAAAPESTASAARA